jgi:hypothetical protein
MSTPDEVAKLREIKRLLDRIQQLPHIAAAAAGNGVHNGFFAGSFHSPSADAGNDERDGYYQDAPYSPAPAAGNGAHNGFHTDSFDAPATAPRNGVHGGLYPEPPLPSPVAPDPEPPPMPAPSLGSLGFRDERHPAESRALVPVQPSGTTGISPWLFVTATAVNTIIAPCWPSSQPWAWGAATQESRAGRNDGQRRPHGCETKHLAEPILVRPIALLPLARAAPSPRALKPSRFPLQVRPEEAMQGSYILVLTGLPANATLSGATRMGSDSWLIAPGALRQLEIVLPEWSASVIELRVELRHANGVVAAQGKAWLAVPPPPVPQGAKLEAAIKEMQQRGDRLLGRGDVAAARAVYERAAQLGSAQAALVLGSTYDPGRLWSLGVFGMVGNKERARHWYQRADQLGHPEAKDRLKALR